MEIEINLNSILSEKIILQQVKRLYSTSERERIKHLLIVKDKEKIIIICEKIKND